MSPLEISLDLQQSEPYLLIQECYRVLRNGKSNVAWEILRQSEQFMQWNHYPKGDVFDPISHSQYFYHAHPAANDGSPREEHGHFHLFLRKAGIPEHCQPLTMDTKDAPEGSLYQDLSHLVAIAMDKRGYPIKLFTTNRWVTGETWYPAPAVTQMLDRFVIDHAYPSWPVNIWLSSMVKLFKAQIIELLLQRDLAIAEWQTQYPDNNVYEDRRLEILSSVEVFLE